MAYRKEMRASTDQRVFSRTAQKVHPKNAQPTPMRGGFRI